MKRLISALLACSVFALPCLGRDYGDVSGLDWNVAYIDYVSDAGYMTGGEGIFSPNSASDRGTVALALAHLWGDDSLRTVPGGYVDVGAESPYAQGIAWCVEQGIMSGYSTEYFGTSQGLLREQFAAALYAFAQMEGLDVSTSGQAIEGYGDAWSIPIWAKEAMNWAVETGLMSGTSQGNLNPQGEMTRGELAVMLTAYDFYRQGKNHLEELDFSVDMDTLSPSEQRYYWISINTPSEFATGAELGQQIADFARCFEGFPYVENQSSLDGFDCAGLAMYVYGVFGISLEHSPRLQYMAGTAVAKADLLPGDLLVFGSMAHVGIYLGEGYFIHASTPTNGVIISHLEQSYYVQNYYGARRLI